LLSLFSVVKEKVTAIFMLIILVLWAVELVIVFIANDSFLEPNALAWLGSLAPNLVILASLWLIYEARAKTGRS
ncbi:MAG: hypothetical protein D6B26_01380, partial [Spirochaetaceae bacterium]